MSASGEIRVLIVDDSPTMRNLLKRALGEGGYRVVEAGSGPEGLRRLGSEPIDLILSDVNMPVMDGFAFVEAVRGEASSRHIPVLFLTTEDAPETIRRGKALGANGWIVKPFQPEQLRAVVATVLARRRPQGSAALPPGA